MAIKSFNEKLEQIRKNSPEVYPEFMELGKMPPQSLALEEAIIGSIIIEKDSFFKVCNLLKPETFYKEEHKIIYKHIQEMFEKGIKVDILTLTNNLRISKELENIGGAYYLTELTNRISGTSNIEVYASILAEKYILRELIRSSGEIQELAYSDEADAFELLDETLNKINQITDYLTDNNAKSAKQIVKEIYQNNTNPDIIKNYSKFKSINSIIGSYNSGKVYIYAGRPGHGKSLMAINEAEFLSQTKPVLYFSLEMTREELINRICAYYSKIPNYRVQNKEIRNGEEQQYDQAMGRIEKLNLFINDTAGLTIGKIHLIAKKMKYQFNIGSIIIDHFHLIATKGKDKMEELSHNSRMLKVIAKDLGLPIICLFALNRDQEKRSGSKKPQMSDLREVGEQDADVVNFLTRPELFDLTETKDHYSTVNLIVLNNLKNRGGKVGEEIKFNFDGDSQEIYENDSLPDLDYRNISEPLKTPFD